MNLTDREKEQLKTLIDGGQPLPRDDSVAWLCQVQPTEQAAMPMAAQGDGACRCDAASLSISRGSAGRDDSRVKKD
jgi:hypothetical protein